MSDTPASLDEVTAAAAGSLPPQPFEKVRLDSGVQVASNGVWRVIAVEDSKLILKRGATFEVTPQGEKILPQLNALAGELLADSSMAPKALKGRLLALAQSVQVRELPRKEALCVQLNGVYVYINGMEIVVSDREL